MKSTPIYITREAPDGSYGFIKLNPYLTLTVVLLVWANVVVWGVIGLVVAARFFG